MNNSVILNAKQKMQFNLNFVQQYKVRVVELQKDIRGKIQALQPRLSSVNVDDPNWLLLWKGWKPQRSLCHLFDSLEFYLTAEEFLDSKIEEIELTMQARFENQIDPMKIAMHQISHQKKLDELEKSDGAECEELLTELAAGMLMDSENGQDFQVSSNNIFGS